MARRRRLKWWQIASGFLLYAALAAGLGAIIGLVVAGIRVLVDPPLSYFVVLPVLLIVIIGYYKFIWVPSLTLRFAKNESDV